MINPLTEYLIELDIRFTKIYIILSKSESIRAGTEFFTFICNPKFFIVQIGLKISLIS